MSVHLSRSAAVAAAALMAAFAVHAEPSNKWRIDLNHTAENDGTVVFRIAPVGQQPIDVETKIPSGTHENHAAKLLRDSLKASLGKGYKVETDDGEDVLIKRKGKTPDFELTMVSSSLTGLEVKLERE